MKNEGKLLISVPNAEYPLNLNLFCSDITHKFIYNKLSMEQLLTTSGYKSIDYLYINSLTTYDRSAIKQFVKTYLLVPISKIGELFWKMIGASQGVFLANPKPTMFCLVKVEN